MDSVQFSPRSAAHANLFSYPQSQSASHQFAQDYAPSLTGYPHYPNQEYSELHTQPTPLTHFSSYNSLHPSSSNSLSVDLYPSSSTIDANISSSSPLAFDNYLLDRTRSVDSLTLDTIQHPTYSFSTSSFSINADTLNLTAASDFSTGVSVFHEESASVIPLSHQREIHQTNRSTLPYFPEISHSGSSHYAPLSHSTESAQHFDLNINQSSELMTSYKKRTRESESYPEHSSSPFSVASSDDNSTGSPIESSGSSIKSARSALDLKESTALTLVVSSTSSSGSSDDQQQLVRAKRTKPYTKYSHLKSQVTAEELERRRKLHRKEQHQFTDRQRRAKIKECMEKLKTMLPIHIPKADQATIAAETVEYVQSLQDEIAELRRLVIQQKASNISPTLGISSGLNGAGVSLVRLSLDCRIIEVNMVFEMCTGFSFAELRNLCPGHPPLNAFTSVIPKELSKFAGCIYVPITTTVEYDTEIPVAKHNGEVTTIEPLSGTTKKSAVVSKIISCVVGTCNSKASDQLSFATQPVIPCENLDSFFPFARPTDFQSFGPSILTANALFLIEAIRRLPPQHNLQMLTRIQMSNGNWMESVQIFTITRNMANEPESLVCITTPELRRVLPANQFKRKHLLVA